MTKRAGGCGSLRSRRLGSGAGSRQRLVQIGDDIGRILDPDRQAHDVIRRARRRPAFGRQLAMGG